MTTDDAAMEELRRAVQPVMEAASEFAAACATGPRTKVVRQWVSPKERAALERAAMAAVAEARADEHILGCPTSFVGTGIVGCECERGGEIAALVARLTREGEQR